LPTITFLGERRAIIAHALDSADMLAGQTKEYQRFGREEVVASKGRERVATFGLRST
jgi:hypothetical protein